MEEQILKILLLGTNHRGAFVSCMYVLVCLKNSGYVTDKYITSISKKVYIDEVDDIFDKCNNIYHVIIKMKPIKLLCRSPAMTLMLKMIKILNLKLVTM